MKFSKDMLLLYAVTECGLETQTLLNKVERALKGGVTILQLREKDISDSEYLERAKEVGKLCKKYSVPFIVNDNVEIAIKSGADGVHVGAEDMSVMKIRKMVGQDFIIGATAKTIEQAKRAQEEGADYMGVGAIFPSPTKKNALRITNEKLREICSCVNIPAVAIGGITGENVLQIRKSGVSGIAVVSAIFGSDDVEKAAAEMKEKATLVTCAKGEEL